MDFDTIKSKPLSLEHARPLKGILNHIGNGLSEYCFANLYLFRKIHDYAVISDNRSPLGIQGKTYDGLTCFMPLFDLGPADPVDLAGLINEFGSLYPVTREDLEQFEIDRFVAAHNPDDSDYVYDAEKMQSYRGRKLAPKRNLVKQFLAEHSVSCRPYHPELRNDAEMILNEWQQDNGNPLRDTDYYPAFEALTLTRELDLFGYVYYVGHEPAGFILAGENTPRMCVVHFAKGSRRFKGIFPYMFNHFANVQGDRFDYYNFEQDLGKRNFKKNKRSYNPDRLLVKYRVKIKL